MKQPYRCDPDDGIGKEVVPEGWWFGHPLLPIPSPADPPRPASLLFLGVSRAAG